jgi:hypothetical protein
VTGGAKETPRTIGVTALTLAVGLVHPAAVRAEEIKVWASRALATVLAEVGPRFERESGHPLVVSSDLPDAAKHTKSTKHTKSGKNLATERAEGATSGTAGSMV